MRREETAAVPSSTKKCIDSSIGIDITISWNFAKGLKEPSDKFIFIPIVRAVKPLATLIFLLLFPDSSKKRLTRCLQLNCKHLLKR